MTPKRLIRSTTVLCVRRNGTVVLAGDGQVTLGESVIKHTGRVAQAFELADATDTVGGAGGAGF